MLLGIKWYQFVQNDDVRRLTKQPKLTAIIQSCWLTVFGHIMRMDVGRQHRCQEDPVSLPFGRLEKTTRSSPHHVAQHRPTRSETTPPYAFQSSKFGSELPSVEDDVDVWRYAILELHARNDDDDPVLKRSVMQSQCALRRHIVCKQVRNCDLSKKFLMFYETCAFVLPDNVL